jgi:two-component sensor histidine kinase
MSNCSVLHIAAKYQLSEALEQHMPEYRKTPEAVVALTLEQYRATQETNADQPRPESDGNVNADAQLQRAFPTEGKSGEDDEASARTRGQSACRPFRRRDHVERVRHVSLSRAHGSRELDEVAGLQQSGARRITRQKLHQLAITPVSADPSSKFEHMVVASKHLSTERAALLGTVLRVANPAASGGRAVLRPLWANEAMHRAYNLVTLTRLLDWHIPQRQCISISKNLEQKNALALAEAYAALEIVDDNELVPCSDLIRTTSRSLVELFGPAFGNIAVKTSLPRLSLPAFKRRALVLACSEFVVNSLRHAFPERTYGTIVIALTGIDRRQLRLTVADDGVGIPIPSTTGRLALGIAADLALLLEGELGYRSPGLGGTIAEISFPAVV